VHVEVARSRAVHARDLHVAAERNRADPVLDDGNPPLRETPGGRVGLYELV
jgi:hypothetical protein